MAGFSLRIQKKTATIAGNHPYTRGNKAHLLNTILYTAAKKKQTIMAKLSLIKVNRH